MRVIRAIEITFSRRGNEMTKEVAITRLKHSSMYIHDRETADYIIKVLEQQSSDDCVSRQAVLDCLTATGLKKFDFILDAREKVNNLSPVTPIQGICKDCHNAVKNYGNGRIYCLFSNCIYDEDFYCKKFEKRGSENGI